MAKHIHIWMELESDNFGRPIKYKCIDCQLERSIKQEPSLVSYFDKLNSIHVRIAENEQKITFIRLQEIGGINESLHLNHLKNENRTLETLLN